MVSKIQGNGVVDTAAGQEAPIARSGTDICTRGTESSTFAVE